MSRGRLSSSFSGLPAYIVVMAQASHTPPPIGPVIAYYDAQCPICVAEMSRYARHGEDKIKLVDANGPDLPPDVDRASALAAMHVRHPDGRVITGWSAFITIWDHLPGWGWLASLTRPAVIRLPLDWIYRRLAPYRPRRTCQNGQCTLD